MPIQLEPLEARRLALAIVAQALRDARTKSAQPQKANEAEAARRWLAGGDAAYLLELAGLRIRQADIDKVLQ